jgi:RHS repeat-associated protein
MSKTTIGLFDDLYRLKQTQLTSDQQGTVFTETTYDLLGRKSTVTNPHRTASAPTDGTTTFHYDAFDRACLLVPPDGTQPTGSSCPSTRPPGDVLTSYSANTVTVTDQAGKSRKSVSDGLGRLTQVFEDPTGLSYETDYQYDALDNLTRDDQKGGDGNSGNWRTRTFAYDSLSRLLCAANPEIQIVMCPSPDNGSYTAGTTRYTYDSDGNVLTKQSPKPNQTSGSVTVTATFAYDALNRLKSKSFDNGDPTINYAYDAVTPTGCTPGSFSYGNAVGKRTAICDAAGMELWGYSITSGIGWLTTDQRTTNSVTKTTSYQNNFDGMLASLTYPSGRVITFTPDGAGRTSKAIDVPNSISYVTGTCANGTDNLGACYTPPGSLSSVTNGPSLVSTFYYNSRLQPCRISVKSSGTAPVSCVDTALGNVLDFTYNFNLGSSDNGNVAAITNNRDTTRSQSFTYDALNRLFTAKTASTSGTKCWDEQFGYDPWANLLTISRISGYTCSNEELLNVAATTKNQISGYTYDAAGNLINDGLGHAYTFSAENQLLTAGGVTYTYDGDGKRAKKSNGKLYWYGMGSDPLTETDTAGTPSAEYISFGGKRIARIDLPSAAVHYYFSDHLGSANVVTSNIGVIQDESDYYPFGGERAITNSDPNNYKFTGKERDSESGLDNFGARYNSSAMGRFMSPDPKHVSAHLSDPQSFDRYAYARNNPLLYIDPDGKDFEKAAQDLKTFAKSIYIKVSIGVGYEAKVKVGAVETKVGAAAKATAETSQDAILKVSRSAEAGASSGPTTGPKAGENISVEQTVLTINKEGTLTGAEKPTVTVTDTIGGNTSVNSSPEQIGLGLETPLGPEPIVGGAEVGTTREGLNALKDASSEVKDSLTNPGPPQPPKPPTPPPCSGNSNNKCPN